MKVLKIKSKSKSKSKSILYATIFLLVAFDVSCQGFAPDFLTWTVPIGGKQTSVGNWGFNAIGGSASTSSILNSQTWSLLDLNGDGKSDLVVTGQNNANGYDTVFSPSSVPYWKVYLNTDSGFSTTAINWTVPVGGKQTSLGNWGFNAIGGSASTSSILNNQTWSLVDLNGDGKPDLVVTGQNNANGYDTVFSPSSVPYWKVYLNTDSGFSTTAINWIVPVGGKQTSVGNWGFNAIGGSASTSSILNSQTWSLLDLNGDRKPDLVVTGQNDANGYDTVFSPSSVPYWKVYLNTDSGFSTTAINWIVPVGGKQTTVGNWGFNDIAGSASTSSILNSQTWSLVDLNGDGQLDLVVTGQNNANGYDTVFSPSSVPYWKIYFNTGSGFSTTATNWIVPVGGKQTSLGNWGFNAIGGSASTSSILNSQTWSLVDLNGDGKSDLVVTGQNNANGYDTVFSPSSVPYWKVYSNTGSQFSTTATNWIVPVGGKQTSLGNWGFNDIGGSASTSPILNNQTWSVVDLNSDGQLDLVVTAQNNADGYDTVFSPSSVPYWKVYLNTTPLGIDNFNDNQSGFALYPNPSQDYFELQSDRNIQQVQVYSLHGQLVKTFNKEQRYDVSDLASGVYVVKISGDMTVSRKLVKE
ncbi:MAG: T9SS type A sorting domain-containing protein [Flavobacterium sp.]|nr:T9SS type A sorting domain-containing protein [Flavobacterium sp.]